MCVTLLLDGKFPTGFVVLTKGAMNLLSPGETANALLRHVSCDWGDLDEQDWRTNDEAVEFGARILSQYRGANGTKFWIITEHDRSMTTILLPDEY